MAPQAFICLKAIIFTFFVLLTAILGSVLLGGCGWLLFFLSPLTYRLFGDYVIAMWEASLVVSITWIIDNLT